MNVVSDDSSLKSSSEVVTLADYSLNNGFITIKTTSYGCTFINSYEVALASKRDNAIEVLQTQPDVCGMKPRSVSLQYSYKHLGLDMDKSVQVKNPVRSHQSTAMN